MRKASFETLTRGRVPTIVRNIVGRCHVGETKLAVCKYLVSRLRDGRATFLAMPARDRRQLIAYAIKAHAENRRLYRTVMER